MRVFLRIGMGAVGEAVAAGVVVAGEGRSDLALN